MATKTYTLHRWAYTKWQYGNEIFNVPSRTWLMAFLTFKNHRRHSDITFRYSGQEWFDLLDSCTEYLHNIGYIASRTVGPTRPFGRINPNF